MAGQNISQPFSMQGIARGNTANIVQSDSAANNFPQPRQIEVFAAGSIAVVDANGNVAVIPVPAEAIPYILTGYYVRVNDTGTDIADANIISYWD